MPEFIIIVAIAKNGVIGRKGKLPWHIPSDLKHFKKTTMNHPIIMGRKTFDSIGRPLPGRDNLILTRDTSWNFPGCITIHSLQAALNISAKYDKVFIIGGGDIFKATLPIIDTIIVTSLEREVEGDVMFPNIDPKLFRQVEITHHNIEEPYSIIRYERIKSI